MIRIKEIDINDRPRERALKEGFSSLSDAELLAIIIRTGTKDKSSLDLANYLLSEFKGLNHLMYSDTYELMKIKGISKLNISINCLDRFLFNETIDFITLVGALESLKLNLFYKLNIRDII